MEESEEADQPTEKPIIIRNTTDLQRLKLEKLMKNPEKLMLLPEKPKERGVPTVPDFVRNVMGSSAGAGSGEFHVYRHLRRKEYARQRYMKAIGEKEQLDKDYQNKIEENKRLADEKTAKKRAKRLKKKKQQKGKNKKLKLEKESSSESESQSSDAETETSAGEEHKETINDFKEENECIDVKGKNDQEETTCETIKTDEETDNITSTTDVNI